jgi:hypothetical protein
MPDAVRVFADPEDYSGAVSCVGERNRTVGVGGKPGAAGVKASADRGAVVVEDDVFAIHPAGKSGVGNLDLRVLIAGDASVGNGDSPEHGRGEIGRLRRVDVFGLIANFGGDARVGLGESQERDAEEQADLAELAQRIASERSQRF